MSTKLKKIVTRCTPPQYQRTIADTGSTGNYGSEATPHTNKRVATNPLIVTMPNGDTVKSTHTCDFDLPSLPPEARHGHIFPNFPAGALLSIGVLCDAGCRVSFDNERMIVVYKGNAILRGTRSETETNKLWCIDEPVSQPSQQSAPMQPQRHAFAAAFISAQNTPAFVLAAKLKTTPYATIADRIAFLHGALGNPALSTLCKALDAGFLASWPEITSELVRKYPPRSAAMVQGHLDQTRRNARSTKPTPSTEKQQPAIADPGETDTPPPISLPGKRTNDVYAACFSATGKIFTDQTGRFPHTSTAGNKDMLVVYDYDSNFVHVEAMPSRSGYQILLAYQRAHAILVARGLRPQLQRLDNEASQALVSFLQKEAVDFQLTHARSHRRNAAERAIRTWKNHFVAILCGTDPNFKMVLWDKLLPQAIISLNLLRASHLNPNLSAYAQLHGAFDFNRTPLAPPGTRVFTHVKCEVRGT